MKILSLLPLLVALVLLAACAGPAPSPASESSDLPMPEPTPTPIVILPYEQQEAKLLRELRALSPARDSLYAITDLDHNGRYELFLSQRNKPAHTQLYELDETFSALTDCAYEMTNAEALPDITAAEVPCYYDIKSDTYYYLFSAEHDTPGNGTMVLSLKDGKLYAERATAASFFQSMTEGLASFVWNADSASATEETAPDSAPAEYETPAEDCGILITKNPSGETVTPGSGTWFIAKADNAESETWLIIDPHYGSVRTLESAMSEHNGLELEDLGDGTLAVRNIPQSFSGWAVVCRFSNSSGNRTTEPAYIRVVQPEPTPGPTQP